MAVEFINEALSCPRCGTEAVAIGPITSPWVEVADRFQWRRTCLEAPTALVPPGCCALLAAFQETLERRMQRDLGMKDL